MTMKELIRLLHEKQCSCVIDNGEVRIFMQRGVADLYELLDRESDFLKGASIADKVVGKAAAALMILGGVKELHADVISLPALALLREPDVKVDSTEVVPYIKNRDQSGWCPLETMCYKEGSATDILPLVREFIEAKKKSLLTSKK